MALTAVLLIGRAFTRNVSHVFCCSVLPFKRLPSQSRDTLAIEFPASRMQAQHMDLAQLVGLD